MKKTFLTVVSAIALLTISCETSRKSSLTSSTTPPPPAEVVVPQTQQAVNDSISKYYVSKKHAAMNQSKINPNAQRAPMTREEKRAMLAPEQPTKPKQR